MKNYIIIFLFILSIIACGQATPKEWQEKIATNTYGYTISYFQFIDNNKRYTYREVGETDKSFCMINKTFVYQVAYINNQYYIKKMKNKTGNIADDLIPAGDTITEGSTVLLELEKNKVKETIKKIDSVISTKAIELLTDAENEK